MDIVSRLKEVGLSDVEINNIINHIEDNFKRKNKCYGLVFEEHTEDIGDINLLYLVKKTEILEDKENLQQMNLLIEGENLQALTMMQSDYHGLIDIIYIDPPYNTGNKDFIYSDSYVDKTDMYRHSKWLSFMKKRLLLARELLSDDGVIFISIDDNEQASLKLLCDEIFGEENFYGELIQLKGNTQNDSKSIQKNHEYILCYVKSLKPDLLTYINETYKPVYENTYVLGRDTGSSSGHDKLIERPNLGYTVYYKESSINGATGNHNQLIERLNLGYTVYHKESSINGANGNYNQLIECLNYCSQKYGEFNYYISSDNKKIIHAIAVKDYDISKVGQDSKLEEVYTNIEDLINFGYIPIRPPLRKGNKLGCWTWSLDTFKKYWNNNEVLIKDNSKIIKKEYIDTNNIITIKNKKYCKNITTLPLKSIIDISNTKGTSLLKGNSGILPGCNFQNPKSIELLKHLIGAYYKKDATVLDFFAGSGTTGQAVLELNKEDGGNRKFILCTNNQNNICEEITYNRLKTVITGIRPDGSVYSEGLPANFTYYKIEKKETI